MNHMASERGAALVELAVSMVLMLVMVFGAADFARVYYTAIELTNAARAGAQYGALNTINSSDTATMQSRALAASPEITGYTVGTPTRTCWCANDTGSVHTSQSCTASCSSGQHLVVLVTVSASKTFTTLTQGFGIPRTVTMSRAVTMRAQ